MLAPYLIPPTEASLFVVVSFSERVLCCSSAKWRTGMQQQVTCSSLLHHISAVGPLLGARKSFSSMHGQTKCVQI